MKKNIIAFFLSASLFFTFAAFSQAQTNGTNNSSQTNDKKLKIVKKPVAKAGNCSESSGLVVIRVTFDKAGTISKAEIAQSSGCDSFDNNSLSAARAIKFEPETKNGEPITVTKRVEYKFQKY